MGQMGSTPTPEEWRACVEMGAEMIAAINGKDKRLLFGAIGLISDFMFSTYFEDEAERRTAFEEYVNKLRVSIFKLQ